MNYKTIDRKTSFAIISLAFSQQTILQASEINKEMENQRVVFSQKPLKVITSCRMKYIYIHEVHFSMLTPKEQQISDIIKCQFFQLQANSIQPPLLGLCVIVDIANKIFEKEESNKEPFISRYSQLVKISKQFSLNSEDSLNSEITSDIIKAVSEKIEKPILYIEIGDKFYSLGPIDIIKRAIYANPDEQSIDDKSWLRDHKLISLIRSCRKDTVVVCYNNYLKRAVFSLPSDKEIVVAEDTDGETQNQRRTAILKIRKNRLYRNIAISAFPFVITSFPLVITAGYLYKEFLLNLPIIKTMGLSLSSMIGFFKKSGSKISTYFCSLCNKK